MRANINDRRSVERIYPRAVFVQEAQANMRAKATVLHGVLIQTAPDETGAFRLLRASRHVGEDDSAANSVFLSPFAQNGGAATHEAGYDSFVEQIIATARNAKFDPAPGHGADERVKGARQ